MQFHKAAELELNEAFEYYEQIRPELGFRFIASVKESIERIKKFPEAYLSFSRNTRRCIVNKFPYAILSFCCKTGNGILYISLSSSNESLNAMALITSISTNAKRRSK